MLSKLPISRRLWNETKKTEITSIYGGDGTKIDSYISHYGYVNIPLFKHKKKPISMIKALQVRDRINNKKLFYSSIDWNKAKQEVFKKKINLPE